MVKKVLIIGAGASGLTVLKVCSVEYGLDAWCYEKTHDLGGLWRYKPEECDGESSVMKSTVINTSKEMMAYSDFPPAAEYPNFMHNRDVLEYFRSYAKSFNLLERIKFSTEIQSVKRTDDYDLTGRWQVTTKNLKTGETKIEIFDAVFACTGHHVFPYEAAINGIADGTFKGRILHSHSYKDPQGFEDKRVVVVGIGNSGGDIAVELSRSAEKVYLVARRGTWVLNRIFDNGKPLDMALSSRAAQVVKGVFPNLSAAFTEYKLNSRFDHAKYGLKPRHHFFQQHPTVNDELPNRIQCGTIVVKPNIKGVEGSNTILFEDGSRAENIDAVVLCTGYSFGFPYLEGGKLIPVENNRVKLYKYMYAPDLAHPETFVVIGCFQPLGALMPISEMQARVACEILRDNSKLRLPPRSVMYEDIERKTTSMRHRYVESRRHTIQVDYVKFMDELADMIGAKPAPSEYILNDPQLAWSLLFGPCLPYQYRLKGPNAWKGARDAQLTAWDRAWYPTKSKIGACENGMCTCSEGNGCHVRKAESTARLVVIGVILALILLLIVIF